MIKSLHSIVIFALCCAPVFGQQRGQGRGNPGVSPQTIMDTAEVRVTRVQLEAGAVRPSHVHNEGPFHIFIPITSPVEIFFGPEGKEERETIAPGQVHLFKSNTPHGFKNAGSTPVDRKSTRLNSSHLVISYAVFCLK